MTMAVEYTRLNNIISTFFNLINNVNNVNNNNNNNNNTGADPGFSKGEGILVSDIKKY